MVKMHGANRPAFMLCIRSLLWTLIVTSFLCFFWVLFVRPTNWYGNDTGGHFGKLWDALEVPLHALEDQVKNLDAPVISGENMSMVLLLTGSTVLAALCVLALKSLPQAQRPVNSPAAKLKLKVQAILSKEVPPHNFWQWMCGGMSVLDVFLVLFWLGLMLTWVWAEVAGRIPRIKANMAAGTAKQSYSLSLLDSVAQSFGWAATPNILLLFYPVPRNSFLHWLFGTDFPGLIKYHRWLGTGTILAVSIHLFLYFCLWWHTSRWVEETFNWPDRGVNNLAGVCAWLCGMAMLISATSFIRRRWYSVFYTFHIVGFVGFILFAFIHYQGMWQYTYPGFALYLLDATFRIAQRMHVTPADASSKASDDGTLATLSFRWSHVADVLPSQIVWINIPSISILHWHPVSVAHVQLDDGHNIDSTGTVTVHYKAYGAWTKALVKELQSGKLPLVRANGPFGCAAGHKWGGHQVMVIFAGGIGITPMLGMLRHMAAHARSRKTDPLHDTQLPDKVYLVWSARSRAELALLDRELVDIARQDEAWLDIKLHCTNKEATPTRTDTAKALDKIPQLPGAAANSPADHIAAAKNPDAVSLSDLSYDSKTAFSGHSSASAFFIQPGGVVSYGFGNLHWAIAHVVSMLGAFLAGILIYSYSAERNNTSAAGLHTCTVGILLFAATCIMTMGLASAIILPMHFFRYWSDRRQVQKQNSSSAASRGGPAAGLDGSLSKRMSQLEAQDNIEVANSRPDLAAVLKQAIAAHSTSQKISVFVAGPEVMFTKAKQTCAFINSQAAAKSPILTVHRQAYTL